MPEGAGGAESVADQATPADQVPDDQGADDADRDDAHPQQPGHGAPDPRGGVGPLKESTQLGPPGFRHR